VAKVKVAILGSGNIGTDLMIKLERSSHLELTAMIGIDPESDGLKKAKTKGYYVFDGGLKQFLSEASELADLVFDATSAKAHVRHAKALREAGKMVIDLTPAAVGPYVVPSVNLGDYLEESNLNLITCGGQATIPIVHAINRVAQVHYSEIVATIASKSAGPGTRANIDEFTQTTAHGLEAIGGAKKGKAIIILNPAEPPIIMRNAVYALVECEQMDEVAIARSVQETVAYIQSYVPGYRLRTEPLFEGNKVTVFVEVEGAGDYLPTYSGNLDIMTATAIKVAEEWVQHRVKAASV
jgi:acetaldehyde dehydrogenase (acetylating)